MTPKRKKEEKIRGIQEFLEKHRRFDFRYIPVGKNWKSPDGNYKYRRRGIDRFAVGFIRTALFLLAPVLLFTVYGVRVEGRKNLKALKKQGAISVCNHFNYVDTLFVRQAVGHFRSFHTMGPWNNKNRLGGFLIRHAGMWPFSADLKAMKHLNEEMERQLARGKIVNFYAEQVMWTNYKKPRPMKDGAFRYAIKYGVPVLPLFCSLERGRGGRAKKVRVHILEPVYADGSLPLRERIADMRTRAEAAWKACYEKSYGVPLEYLPEEHFKQ